MSKIGEAFIELRADLKKFNADMATARSDTKKHADGIASDLTKVIGAVAFGAGLKKSIDAASDLNETISKTQQLFGKDADEVIKFGTTTAQSMGMSQRAYLDAASGLKGLLDNLGLAPDMATQWSQKLTQLGSDLGSFFNKDPAEAVAAIGSAIRGESEPIRAFNVNISQAAVQQKALTLGLYDGTGALTTAAKAQATLALITDQTTAAQGDFARTADGAANSQRVASATMENSAASLGKSFLPIYTKIVQMVTFLAEGFQKLPGPVQVAVVALVGMVALAGPLLKVKDLFSTLNTAVKNLSPNMKSAGVAFGVFSAVAILGFTLRANAAKKAAEQLAEAIDQMTRATADKDAAQGFITAIGNMALHGKSAAAAMAELTKQNLEGAKRILDVGAAAGVPAGMLDMLATAVANEEAMEAKAAETHQKYGAATDDSTAAIGANTDALNQQGADLLESILNTDDTRRATDRATAADEAAKKANEDLATALGDTSNKFSDAASAASDLKKAIDEVFGSTQNVEEAQRGLEASIDDVATSLKSNGKTLDIHTEKGRANREAIEKQANALIDYGVSLVGSGKSNEEAAAAIDAGTTALKAQLKAAGLTDAQVNDYITTLGLTPENVNTAITLTEVEKTKGDLADALKLIGDIPESTATKIQADIDQGRYDTAAARLNELAKDRGIKLNLVAGNALKLTFAEGTTPLLRFMPYTALGGYFDREQVRTFAEGGQPEAALPLTNIARMREILADPRVGGPVAAAMSGGGGGNTTVSRTVGGVTFTGDFHHEADIDAAFRLANFYMAGV